MMKMTSLTDKTGLNARLRNVRKRGFKPRYWWYRFKWNYYPRLRLANPVPLHVDIESTDACNLRCAMCIHGQGGVKETGFIKPELTYKAIDQCAELGVYSIKFNYRGEPLLHKNLADFVKYAKQRGIMEVQFNTNGLPVSEVEIEALIKAGLDRIIFSVDGAKKETYERVRIGGSYERLLKNIDTFLEIKRRDGLKKPFIRVQMVKDPGGEKEARQFIEFWTRKGVDNIAVINKQDRDNRGGAPLKDGKRPLGRTFCDQPWQRLVVTRDGKVLMCCGDWYRKTVIGDLNKESLKQIWHSELLRGHRSMIARGLLADIAACKTCFRPTTYKWD
ncbi:MAG: radical SAM protein [Candidatus Omnitrophica bacterium]|nr:radical SAM protein [Candidatus Omnitrophota bacterium]